MNTLYIAAASSAIAGAAVAGVTVHVVDGAQIINLSAEVSKLSSDGARLSRRVSSCDAIAAELRRQREEAERTRRALAQALGSLSGSWRPSPAFRP
jgi:hypothetical protein